MDRTTEVELLAVIQEEPVRALLRAALVAQRQGRISDASRVVRDLLKKHPRLWWPAVLLALDAAELRLGGSVAIATPQTTFTLDGSTFGVAIGVFGMIVYPEGDRLTLRLARGAAPEGGLVLETVEIKCSLFVGSPAVAARSPTAIATNASPALQVLARELGDHLGELVVRPIGGRA